jgi:hypothetical protein
MNSHLFIYQRRSHCFRNTGQVQHLLSHHFVYCFFASYVADVKSYAVWHAAECTGTKAFYYFLVSEVHGDPGSRNVSIPILVYS